MQGELQKTGSRYKETSFSGNLQTPFVIMDIPDRDGKFLTSEKKWFFQALREQVPSSSATTLERFLISLLSRLASTRGFIVSNGHFSSEFYVTN
jgi:hypothetical protein